MRMVKRYFFSVEMTINSDIMNVESYIYGTFVVQYDMNEANINVTLTFFL